MSPKDDAGDLVETAYLMMGLLCARQYFSEDAAAARRLRGDIDTLWREVEWDWFTQGGQDVLYWHWSPIHGWAMNHQVHGWNECLITYVLAASSPRYAIEPSVYHRGFATGPGFVNGKSYYDIELPLGMPYGGPLFIAHYSFCGLDPRGLKDRYADYWDLNVRHVRINHAHAVANPLKHKGHSAACWGFTASDDFGGYGAQEGLRKPEISKTHLGSRGNVSQDQSEERKSRPKKTIGPGTYPMAKRGERIKRILYS